METIYSKILWGELGLKDYKIHEEDNGKTNQLILDWIKETPLERVDEVLFSDLSWIDRITDDGYYDGQFHGINQRVENKMYKTDDGEPQSDIVIHDCGLLPSILHIAIKTGSQPEEFYFIAKILEVYYEKKTLLKTIPINSKTEG